MIAINNSNNINNAENDKKENENSGHMEMTSVHYW